MVTAATRTPSAATGKAQYVTFDYSDPLTFSAVNGHQAVFLLGPPLDPRLYELLEPFVDYLATNERPRVVYLSAYGMDASEEMPFHARMEEKLRSTGLDLTILRPTFFASNFGQYERENIEVRDMIFSPSGTGVTAFIDPADIGRSAAVALNETAHVGKTYALSGPHAHSMSEVADLLTGIIGKKVVYPAPTNEVYRDVLRQGGAPDFVADYMIPVYNLIRDNKVGQTSDAVERLTGKSPTGLREVLERDFG